tara:strand:+ start:710 stop:1249 length:540 start_codon:yes stop_codon:yes gene_type:complete
LTSVPGSDIQARVASLLHLETIIDFNIAMAKETEGKELSAEVVRPGVEAVLTRNDLGFYIICEHTGRPVGQLMITYEWSDWRNAFFWWIQSVYVSPVYRRLGVYKALHYYAAKEARRQGNVCGLRLYVDKNNTIAQGVYAGLRMSPTNYDMYEIHFNACPAQRLAEVEKEQEVNDDATE